MDRACGTRYRLVLGAAGGLRDGARQVISTVNRMGTPLLGRRSDGYPYDHPWSDRLPLRLLMPVGYPAENARVPDLNRKSLDEVSEFFE